MEKLVAVLNPDGTYEAADVVVSAHMTMTPIT